MSVAETIDVVAEALAISITRRAATRHEAISALRSAVHQSGVRVWCMISLIRSSLYTPFFQILTGGMRTPSWKIAVRVDRHRAGDLAADVGLVAEHRGIGDQPAVLEHRQQHQPVVANG